METLLMIYTVIIFFLIYALDSYIVRLKQEKERNFKIEKAFFEMVEANINLVEKYGIIDDEDM